MTPATNHQHTVNGSNSAALNPKEAIMANFELGQVVVNFNTTAVVVGFFTRDGSGWPILKALGANGKPRGGKWIADPAKCEVVK